MKQNKYKNNKLTDEERKQLRADLGKPKPNGSAGKAYRFCPHCGVFAVNVYVTLDVGSCHMGSKAYAHELINAAREAGADAVKFQIGVEAPNTDINWDWWPALCGHAKECGIDIYASTFSEMARAWYFQNHINMGGSAKIKFAHSQRHDHGAMRRAKEAGMRVLASADVMTPLPRDVVSVAYFCVPEYPLMWCPTFEGVFYKFDGFSDHSLGFKTVTMEALRNMMQLVSNPAPWYLEKHLKLDKSDIDCPDSLFALTPHEAKYMIQTIRTL